MSAITIKMIVVIKSDYMLENPCIFKYLEAKPPSENFEVRAISRKGLMCAE